MANNNRHLQLENQDFTFLGQNSAFKGEWKLQGPSFIAGKIEGTVIMLSNSPLTLEREGQFSGEFQGADFHIYGCFSGEIKSTATVVIHTNAEVEGKVKAQNIVVHPGARANIDAQTELI